MRSRAPPVADAARRSTRSGRKNRASEQREDFFGHRKADGADAPAATLGAYLCAVRTMLQHRSYPALQATERGSSRGNLSPLTRFCLLLAVQKEAPAGQAYQPSPSGDSAPPPGDHQSALNSHNKSQPHLPSKIHHLCKLDPTFTHFVNLP